MMNSRRYVYLKTAIEIGSMHGAAKYLKVSQPTLSEQIRRLEEDLDLILLTRTTKGVEPTSEALQLLPHFNDAIDAQRALERRASELRSPPDGMVKMGAIALYNLSILPQIMSEAATSLRKSTVEMVESGSMGIIEMVQSRELDIGLIARTPEIPIEDTRRRYIDLAVGSLQICLREDDPLAVFDSIEMEQLRGRGMVAHTGKVLMRHVFDLFKEKYDLQTVAITDSGPSTPRIVSSLGSPAFSTSAEYVGESEQLAVQYRPLVSPSTPILLSVVLRAEERVSHLAGEIIRELRALRYEANWPSGFTPV